MSTLQWILVIAAIAAVVPFFAYTVELVRGKVHRLTRWSDLTPYQLSLPLVSFAGIIVFLVTMIVGAISK